MRSKAESYYDINAMRSFFVSMDDEDTPRMLRHLARIEMDMINLRGPTREYLQYKVVE